MLDANENYHNQLLMHHIFIKKIHLIIITNLFSLFFQINLINFINFYSIKILFIISFLEKLISMLNRIVAIFFTEFFTSFNNILKLINLNFRYMLTNFFILLQQYSII